MGGRFQRGADGGTASANHKAPSHGVNVEVNTKAPNNGHDGKGERTPNNHNTNYSFHSFEETDIFCFYYIQRVVGGGAREGQGAKGWSGAMFFDVLRLT